MRKPVMFLADNIKAIEMIALVLALSACAGSGKVDTASGKPEITVADNVLNVRNTLSVACIDSGGTLAVMGSIGCARKASFGNDLLISFVAGTSMQPTMQIDSYTLLQTPTGTRVIATRYLQKTNAFGVASTYENHDADTLSDLQTSLNRAFPNE